MIVIGYHMIYETINEYVSTEASLLICIKPTYSVQEYYYKLKKGGSIFWITDILSSLFYNKIEVKVKDFISKIKDIVKKSSIEGKGLLVFNEVGDNISPKLLNHVEKSMRKITKQNLFVFYKSRSADGLHFDKIYLSSIYYKFTIRHDRFIEKTHRLAYYKEPLSLSLRNYITDFYSIKNYDIIQVITYNIIERNESFYLEYRFDKNDDKYVSYAISPGESHIRDNIVDAINVYLLHFYANNSDYFAFAKQVFIKEKDESDNNFISSFRYIMNIRMRKADSGESEFHKLFVIYFASNNIAEVVSGDGSIGLVKAIQIIIPYSRWRKYGVRKDKTYLDRNAIKQIASQVINDGALICGARNVPSVIIITK